MVVGHFRLFTKELRARRFSGWLLLREIVVFGPPRRADVTSACHSLAHHPETIAQTCSCRYFRVSLSAPSCEKLREVPNLHCGDFVLVVRIRRLGITPRSMAMCSDPRTIVGARSPHRYQFRSITSGGISTVHVVRLRFYLDIQLNLTADFKNTL